MKWLKSLWDTIWAAVRIPSLLLGLRKIWYGATEISLTKLEQTKELIAGFLGKEKK